MPKTATGKIQRFRLRALAAQQSHTGGEEMSKTANTPSRRTVLTGLTAAAGLSALPWRGAIGQTAKLKLGVMLPYTGTYAALGDAITAGLKLSIAENGGKLGGREVEYVMLDDESEPAKGPENANKLVTRDKVDFLIGTVHSGVAMGMVKVARDSNTMLIIPNAGADPATGALCAKNIFRTSFSNWQPAFPMGKVAAERGHKRAVAMSWKYAAGEESLKGFKDGFEAGGGKVIEEMFLPFPDVEFQAYLTKIAALKPDAVYVFFAGGGAIKFVKDYVAAGLRQSIPLFGPGFLTDGTLEAQGEAAQGLETTLHYGDGLDLPRNKAFIAGYQKAYNKLPDVYSVQGYDTGQLLTIGLGAVKGDTGARDAMVGAMEKAEIDSPRGKFTFSKSHNPVQDIYLRKVEGLQNKVVGVAVKALADPQSSCKLA
jgi:branched-chain amino acid transport system substrate-binding protein